MPWYNRDYPPSYKNQPETLREKAVEIANALLAQGMEERAAIATGLKRARHYFQQGQESEVNGQHEIEEDRDELEAVDFASSEGSIDSADPKQLTYWAEQFQISTGELKAAIVLMGSDLSEIKKYIKS
ncbi:hypothetical protein CA265_11990 [Sphingobacteriaceae bacterium GW460-11-11-14-LB5]|nr:hypothetical protein CA265_11990 [Sphingobacteriaceae bacterium GW460-11-11-14-LB5]